MKDFFLKIRHFKEAPGRRLWKSSLPLAEAEAARRPGIQDNSVCAQGSLSYARLPARIGGLSLLG